MINYIDLIQVYYPTYEVSVAVGCSPADYNSLVWVTKPKIEKSVLDQLDASVLLLPRGDLDVVVDAKNAKTNCVVTRTASGWSATEKTCDVGRVKGVWDAPIVSAYGTTFFQSSTNVPLVTDGSEIWNIRVTPRSVTNKFKITFTVTVDSNISGIVPIVVFRNNVCIGTFMQKIIVTESGTMPVPVTVVTYDKPNLMQQITYSARVGLLRTGGSWSVNSHMNNASLFSSTTATTCLIEEYEV